MYQHLNIEEFPIEEDVGSSPQDSSKWIKAWIGYLLISISIGKFHTLEKLDLYIQKYLIQDPLNFVHSPLLSKTWMISQGLSFIPLTFLLKQDNVRLKIYTILIILSSLSILIPWVISEVEYNCLIIGIIGGIAQAAITVFPLLKIRDYFENYKTKIFMTGSFYGVTSVLHNSGSLLVVYLIDPLFGVESDLFDATNILHSLKIYALISSLIGVLGVYFVSQSEIDDRYEGLECSEEGVYFIDEDFSEHHIVDSESYSYSWEEEEEQEEEEEEEQTLYDPSSERGSKPSEHVSEMFDSFYEGDYSYLQVALFIFHLISFTILVGIFTYTSLYFKKFKPMKQFTWTFPAINRVFIISIVALIIFPVVSLEHEKKLNDICAIFLFAIMKFSAGYFHFKFVDTNNDSLYTLCVTLDLIGESLVYGIVLKYIVSYTNKWRYLSLSLTFTFHRLVSVFTIIHLQIDSAQPSQSRLFLTMIACVFFSLAIPMISRAALKTKKIKDEKLKQKQE